MQNAVFIQHKQVRVTALLRIWQTYTLLVFPTIYKLAVRQLHIALELRHRTAYRMQTVLRTDRNKKHLTSPDVLNIAPSHPCVYHWTFINPRDNKAEGFSISLYSIYPYTLAVIALLRNLRFISVPNQKKSNYRYTYFQMTILTERKSRSFRFYD